MTIVDLNTRVRRAVARVADRIAPRVPDFHGLLVSQCSVMARGLEALSAFLASGEAVDADAVRAYEKEGDLRRAATLDTLSRAFATPFDRGLIILAATAIDDILNYAKTAVREIETLDVPADDWMRTLGEDLRIGGHSLHAGFAALRDDPQTAGREAMLVHKCERNAEKTYRAAIAEAFDTSKYISPPDDPAANLTAEALERLLLSLRRREVYRHLSNTADRLDEAGRALDFIVMAGE